MFSCVCGSMIARMRLPRINPQHNTLLDAQCAAFSSRQVLTFARTQLALLNSIPSVHSAAACCGLILDSIFARQHELQACEHWSTFDFACLRQASEQLRVHVDAAFAGGAGGAFELSALLQSFPEKPVKQTHVESVTEHMPLPEQSLGQRLTWHVSPVKPSSQWHVPDTHLPW